MTPTESAIQFHSAADAEQLELADRFEPRHIGPTDEEVRAMVEVLDCPSLDALIDATVPQSIRLPQPLELPPPRSEAQLSGDLARLAGENRIVRSLIGMGYHGTVMPAVIERTILGNPHWYTAYTPYQSEIAQGRLEALLNYQTMVAELTALPLANASLLDEATAAAEAMAMCHAIARGQRGVFYVSEDCHPQTLHVVATRAWSMGIELHTFRSESDCDFTQACGVLVQYPTTDGRIADYADLCAAAHEVEVAVVAACDLLALVLIKPPGEWGADIAVGSTQRFGVPMGFGGPHAAFIATSRKHARRMPGRIVGVSQDAEGRPAYRLAIQTREQHIKRARATSNICTAQVLLAIIAGMYAVWHGPEGLKRIARRVHGLTVRLFARLQNAGFPVHGLEPGASGCFFDTLAISVPDPDRVLAVALKNNVCLRKLDSRRISVALDETSTSEDVDLVCSALGAADDDGGARCGFGSLARNSPFLTQPAFRKYQSEHEFLRYVTRLQSRDISLADSMIPLGSCTMKLNSAVQMRPVTWPGFANLHPYAPPQLAAGYRRLFADLEQWLCEITGFAAVSLQPNAGSQGEYAGLLAIRRYHQHRGDPDRRVCLIPSSAHGTNPASAVIAGFQVVAVACDEQGNIDVEDVQAQAQQAGDRLGALMITYPSTHGVFEESIRQVCEIVHCQGGQVYMDGANMNAQVGLCRPADMGADVCHLNLHKTFCIPHGGGGPGMGPIAVADHLSDFLPGHPLAAAAGAACDPQPGASTAFDFSSFTYPVSAAPYGSPSILPISWAYIALMGAGGLTQATKMAILNANYVAKRLSGHYEVLYTGTNGTVAHECIIDCRPFERSASVRVEDIAKRLMDFSFHAPTVSWPVAGTMMIEPTESESKAELDRFCEALIAIRREIAEIESGKLDRNDNPLRNAPHTATMIADDNWPHPYTRRRAVYPSPWLEQPGRKFWPPVARIDNAYGDRNLICTCS